MKKFLILATLLALLCLGTVPALAHAQESAAAPQAPLKVFALTGKITAVDPAARTVTVKVWSGNWLARPHKGETLTLKATDYTRFFEKQEDCSIVPASFDDLEVGQRVSASGRLVGDAWRLWRITIRPAECCCQ